MLFKIEGKEGSVVHYLLGTMHVGNRAAYTYVPKALEVMSSCSRYLGEMNLSDVDPVAMQAASQMPDAQTLTDWVSERQYWRMAKIMNKVFGLQLDHMATMRPMIILNHIASQCVGQDGRPALDHYLWNVAEERGLDCGGLETWEEQIGLLREFPIAPQVKSLQSALRNVKKLRAQQVHLARRYQSGQWEALYQLAKAQVGGLRGPLLYDRNQRMAQRLLAELESHHSVMAAVGAAHIGGNKGIRAALLRSGYRVTVILKAKEKPQRLYTGALDF